MKIAFFTEMGFEGKVPRNHPNMRTEFAWMVALDAYHLNINTIPVETYDLGIVIVPKKSPITSLALYKDFCKKVAVMQEGPHWFFQDYNLHDQISYINILVESDIIYVHNLDDKTYYAGLIGHEDIRIMPTLMIEDPIKDINHSIKRKDVIIGGNFVSWYGGMDSYIVAREWGTRIYCPSMGRKQPGEESLVEHLSYLEWSQWMRELNKFEVGVHLMRTYAAGTFALNCAYLGVPCIGYEGVDTQRLCHPNLTVKEGDLNTAKSLMRQLVKDKDYYNDQSLLARQEYANVYQEKHFIEYFNSKHEDKSDSTSS